MELTKLQEGEKSARAVAPEKPAHAQSSHRKPSTHVNVKVLQTVVIKEIRTPSPFADCDLEILGTMIQRCVLPEGHDEMQFEYRFNDTAVQDSAIHVRKQRVETAIDDDSIRAHVTTYAVRLPLRIEDEILDMYPFSIQTASCKIELTSEASKDNASGNTTTYRPHLQMPKDELDQLVHLKFSDPKKLCRHRIYALGSSVPVVHGKPEQKEGVELYTPIMNIGFYVIEPAIGTLLYMLIPVILIVLMLTRCIDEAREDYTATLVTLTIALVLTLPMIRRGSLSQTSLSPSDLFVLILFVGIGLCVWGIGCTNEYPWRIAGVVTSWASFGVPLLGFFRYNYRLFHIRSAAKGLEFARSSEIGKKRGEAFSSKNLESLPLKTDVANHQDQVFDQVRMSQRFGSMSPSNVPAMFMSSRDIRGRIPSGKSSHDLRVGAAVSTAGSASMH